MSPVSRGRKAKTKKTKKRGAGRPGTAGRGAGDLLTDASPSGFAALQSLTGPRRRPGWFDASVNGVVDRAGVLMAARGPRELEQATAELAGAELYVAVREERHGMWFDWWFQELTDAAAARAREAAGGGARAREGLPGGAAAGQPEWLRLLPRIAATGEVWEMHDAYGTRFAVIAGFSYPGGADPSVFLFDIDACGFVRLASAGVFDDVEQAAAAWRALAGEAASSARPGPVETAERLYCL